MVGHSEAFELVYTTFSARWQDPTLDDRNLDVLAGGDTYSLKRAVREVSYYPVSKEPERSFFHCTKYYLLSILELHRIELHI